MIDVLLTRAVRIILAMPVIVGVLGAGWFGAGIAARAGFEGVLTAALAREADDDCAPDTNALFRRIRRFGPAPVHARLRWTTCGESPDAE
ncbi:MAG: hypothetical protein D6798_01300 [Deltaproteobacteria bacterium]|nr:MAG: hypothetical protein D6798_01300 [Deltaproteobacteria bacterium]